jgi:glutamate-1-semialdehyde 2,1-aminomutase
MMTNWHITDRDRELWQRELSSFVPPRIFDAHVHLYTQSHFHGPPPALCAEGPARVGWQEFQQQIGQLMPDRQWAGVCFPFPATNVDFAATNAFLASECASPKVLGQMLVSPAMDPELVREAVQRHKFVGLKPYHLFAGEKPTFQAGIESFLPPTQMQVAHELGLTVTLHIVRSRALADASNQEALRRYALNYPHAQLILAHAARGFNPHDTLQGIHALRDLPNVWFDTSAITDAGALEAILRVFGHRRLLYGSDFPVSHLRGRCVALGDSFLWLSPENTRLDAAYAEVQFTLVGLEALRTLKVAAFATGLSDEAIEDVFFDNAARLWNR